MEYFRYYSEYGRQINTMLIKSVTFAAFAYGITFLVSVFVAAIIKLIYIALNRKESKGIKYGPGH
jgi:hypothetical protein